MRNIIDSDASSGSSSTATQILPVDNATVPYWRSILHKIDEHRSTEQLPQECDIAIIGAGFSGVATAYHLSKLYGSNETPSIIMLEARQVCSGATGRNGGHVKVKTTTVLSMIKQFGVQQATQFHDFVMAHIPALKEVVETEGIDCEFELRRSYDVFLDQAEADQAKQEFMASLRNGESWTEDRDDIGAELAEQVTSMKGAKAAFSSSICSLWPYKFVTQVLARLLERKSVNLQTNTPVTAVKKDGNINVISTHRGTIKAKRVVFATNGYTAGLMSNYKDTITPVRGTCSHLVPSSPVMPHLNHTYNIAYERPSAASKSRVDYLNPRPDGGIVVGGANWTYDYDKSNWWNNFDDSKVMPEAKPHFETLMQNHFLGWENSGSGLERIWTGIQGYTPDGLPHAGTVPGPQGDENNQWILAGFNGGGNALVWLTAKAVADMVGRGLRYEETGLPAMFKTTRERLAAR